MKQSFKKFVLIWALLFVLFNIVAIVFPGWDNVHPAFSGKVESPSFWIGYSFAALSLIGQLICFWHSLKDNNAQKTFYNASLIKIGYTGMIFSFAVGAICMVITPIPYWISAIVCPAVLVFNAVAVFKVSIAANAVDSLDEKVKISTAFINDMRAESKALVAMAQDEDVKAICKKVADEFAYSDPKSCPELADVELEVKTQYSLFAQAVSNGSAEEIAKLGNMVIAVIQKRNSKCKIYK